MYAQNARVTLSAHTGDKLQSVTCQKGLTVYRKDGNILSSGFKQVSTFWPYSAYMGGFIVYREV